MVGLVIVFAFAIVSEKRGVKWGFFVILPLSFMDNEKTPGGFGRQNVGKNMLSRRNHFSAVTALCFVSLFFKHFPPIF
jgi:hypothetical protein